MHRLLVEQDFAIWERKLASKDDLMDAWDEAMGPANLTTVTRDYSIGTSKEARGERARAERLPVLRGCPLEACR